MAKKRRKRQKQPEPLEAIKRLLILSLAKQGATSQEIGRALEVDSSTIRGIVSFRTNKPKTN
jgi:DNA-binding NarL/FixJ family response regulator